MLLRWLRRIGWALAAPVGLVLLYVGTAWGLMLWPANAGRGGPAEVEAYVITNGVHTDVVLPLVAAGIDWRTDFPPGDARAARPDAAFVAIGWGDREFYLNTPTWADLTARRALGAVLGRNSALLHVTWLARAQLPPGRTWKLALSTAQYHALAAQVRAALPEGRAVRIPGAHYADDDAFYEATGRYHLFQTCNTWTGRVLRQAGVPMSRWTPFDVNVVRHLQPLH